MSAINNLAGFVAGISFADLPSETVESAKMHLLDTLGAMLAGVRTPEGAAIGRFLAKFQAQPGVLVIGYNIRTPLLPAIIAQCSATRSTEIDDIHLESCTTPGSVVVPTALLMARGGYISSPKELLVASTVGYEFLIRVGLAMGGGGVLYCGVWPTYLAATAGSVAVAVRALGLIRQQATSAISMALAMSAGTPIHSRDTISSRWLTIGVAAQNGVIAALSAREGFTADNLPLDRPSGRICGLQLSQEALTDDLKQRYLIDQTGMKPYPVARQALPAIEGFRDIIGADHVNPESIQEIIVWVPRNFMSIIDKPQLPGNRLQTISSVQYQMALAAFDIDGLFDIRRERVNSDPRVRNLMNKIRVKPSRELERSYPSVWGARVEVKTEERRYSRKVLYPKGDPRSMMSWDEVIAKFKWLAGPALGDSSATKVIDFIATLENQESLSSLLESLT